jgi:hypothetical protein
MRAPAEALQTELWTSWASVLRSYAAAHGLHAAQHAVVEVSHDQITLRAGSRWVHFTRDAVRTSEGGAAMPFRLQEDGTVQVGDAPEAEEMDMAAERFARELLL